MCGIAGKFSWATKVDRDQIKKMTDRMVSRGPDAEGFFVKNSVGLGHRRLSIIDLDSGDQPIFNENRKIAIVFNGEVYNFPELKADLLAKGHIFYTNTDTEVIIHGYEEYGIDGILSQLEGMYAFAIYDEEKDSLFIARDRFGEKPLYYFEEGKNFYFGSELKALKDEISHREICVEALNFFLALTYIPSPFTIYKRVFKLLPGHYLHVSQSGVELFRYFEFLSSTENDQINNFDEAKEELRKLLARSVQMRMVSDVPVGTFLSGGIDSSIISALMSKFSEKPVKTFSIGFFEKDFDESERSKYVSKAIGADHTLFFLDFKEASDRINEIVENFDEPFADASAISTYFVAKIAREQVKVVLTGDCADELFGGYEKYLAISYQNQFNQLPKIFQRFIRLIVNNAPHNVFTNNILRKAKKIIKNCEFDEFTINYNLMCLGFNDQERKSLLIEDYDDIVKRIIRQHFESEKQSEILEKLLYTDQNVVLEGCMLPKVDRACMQCSLEARVPFLDSKVVNFSRKLPPEFKIKGRNKKFILKEAFKELLPEKVFSFPKKGFGLPVDRWFRKELRDELYSLIEPEFVKQQGLFEHRILEKLFKEHESCKEDHRFKLWAIYVFQKWWKREFY
ncbi:MAG: asparagine synthase (glutamine-hydrolyzing) [Candidatus Rifleibacteriota bacterium]